MTLIRYGNWYVDPDEGLVLRRVGCRDSNGYLRIDQRFKAEPSLQAHRVIWEAVYGPIPNGMVINHLNGVKDDNRLGNLELTTPSGNIAHAYATGLASNKGIRHPGVKLNHIRVYAIRALAAIGHTPTEIARMSGVSRRQISSIVARKAWAHLPEMTVRLEDF